MIGKPALCISLLLGAVMIATGCSKQENLSKCQSADPNNKIAGCTALIQTGRATTKNLSTAYNNRGAAYADKSEYDRAIQDYNEAIRLNPNFAIAFYGRGRAYDQTGDFDHAIRDHNEAIRLNPNFAIAYNARGAAYRNKGDFNHAIQDYDEAIRLKPNYAVVYNNRGDAYRGVGDYDHAIQDFDEAIRLNPNLSSAYTNRAFIYFLELNLAAATKDYEHVIMAAPSSKTAIFAAIMLHVAMKRQGHDDRKLLATVAAAADLSKWPGPALKLDLGQVTTDEVMAAAAIATYTQKWQVCEANYYTGEDAMSQHQRTIALAHFKAARDSCPKADGAYDAALMELNQLRAPATTPAK